MFLIAITRWGQPLEQELPALAALLGRNAYDVRLQLAGALPVVLAAADDIDTARSLRDDLRTRGHGAVACDMDRRPDAQSMPVPREFELTPAEIRFSGGGWVCPPVGNDDVLALIHTQHAAHEQVITETTAEKFSIGRAMVTGGLSRSKKVQSIDRSNTEEVEQALYVVPKDRRPPILLRQNHLRYAGLGDRIGRTSLECFATLLELLRQRCRGAHYDRSLFVHKRRAGTVTVCSSSEKVSRKTVRSSTVIQSNAEATDLAVHFIVMALAQGQLV